MAPLCLMPHGQVSRIERIGGKREAKLFLEKLGFVPGGEVVVLSEYAGNIIVRVKESRVAISREMAFHIMVREEGR